MVVLADSKKILFSQSLGEATPNIEQGTPAGDVGALWEDRLKKADCQGLIAVNRDEMLRHLKEVVTVQSDGPATEPYHLQLEKLRNRWLASRTSRSAWFTKKGSPGQFWAEENFFLNLFRGFFAGFLPDKKFVVLGLVSDVGNLDTLVLEFRGRDFLGAQDIDFSTIDVPADKLQASVARRLNMYVTKQYNASCYTFLVRESVWHECNALQRQHSAAAAWRYLRQSMKNMGGFRDVVIEPLPLPLKLNLFFRRIRG